jgi:hypothetical protein
MMVIRVAVPRTLAPKMRLYNVCGFLPGPQGPLYELEILSAHYDLPKQPNAR